jgi:hypothetical protein
MTDAAPGWRAGAWLATALLCGADLVAAAPGLPVAGYDTALCATAQRLIVNAPDIAVRVQRGQGDGFHTIQMSVDEDRRELAVAMTTASASVAGETFATYVACKMVDRDRVNDQLGLVLDGPRRSCRDVNEHTFQVAVAQLSPAERQRYARQGRPLVFRDDAVVPTGGEWLPAAAEDYIASDGDGLAVTAPSVRVPWDAQERGFYQGTHHCKLITLAAMQRWLRRVAFEPGAPLYPSAAAACTAPSAPTARAGSCLFYFAPARATFCTDYSGAGWTPASARAACAKRHASREALEAVESRYEGAGGIYDTAGCAARGDGPAVAGTCVFHCNASDEVLWQVPAGADAMVNRACDLYIGPGS